MRGDRAWSRMGTGHLALGAQQKTVEAYGRVTKA